MRDNTPQLRSTMTDAEVEAIVEKSGAGTKFADAVCRIMKWRRAENGRSAEWYAAYRGWLGDALERVLIRREHAAR